MSKIDNIIAGISGKEHEIQSLQIQLDIEINKKYKHLLDENVKISGQKGWNVGVVKDIRYNKHNRSFIATIKHPQSSQQIYIDIKKIELLADSDKKMISMHESISNKVTK